VSEFWRRIVNKKGESSKTGLADTPDPRKEGEERGKGEGEKKNRAGFPSALVKQMKGRGGTSFFTVTGGGKKKNPEKGGENVRAPKKPTHGGKKRS